MWWPLFAAEGGESPLDTGRFRYESQLADIETLNRRSQSGELEITALSCAQYPHVQDRYVLTACGSSLGDGYGPKLVSGRRLTLDGLRNSDVVIAVPGERTSAFAVLSLMLGPGSFRHAVVPFDRIIAEVADGSYGAGLVIHEGQLVFEQSGLHELADLGAWWRKSHDLPLPLGVNAVRRDLGAHHGPGAVAEVASTLLRSVQYAMAHREQSMDRAAAFARGMNLELAERFVDMYVNAWTLDFGPIGRQAVRTFLETIHEAGLAPAPEEDLFAEAVGGPV